MDKLLLHTVKQLHIGEIVSGIGFVLYLAGSALKLPETALCILLGIFSAAAVWTFLSMALFPPERKKEISYNLLWGQGALTILLVVCLVLTVRELTGL